MRAPRADADETRARLLEAAERLIAERGVGVSSRHIGEAAGQGNSSAVGYHFGSKTDLVLAVVRAHGVDLERRRAAHLERLGRRAGLLEWLECVVAPMTGHLESLGSPSWYARFLAQATEEQSLRDVVFVETMASPTMAATVEGLWRALPVLPAEVHAQRGDMMRLLLVHSLAERERRAHAAQGEPSWAETTTALVDALHGLWTAPSRLAPRPSRRRRSS